MHIPVKLPDVGVTIFSVMTALANEHGAINLSQGFPDVDVAPELMARVCAHMQTGHNQYAPMAGVGLLRERIAAKVHQLYGAAYDPETEITVTTGGTEALFCAISAVVLPGDEVLVFEPAFDSYVPAIRLNGGVPVYSPLRFPEYCIDWDDVKDRITPRTRLIILNSPHNPTGAVLTATDLTALQEVVRNTDALILSDEVYEHIIFDGLRHESIARYPELAARSFIVGSFGKSYHTTGWKVGYCLAPRAMTAELQRIHQYVTFSVNTPMQWAYADILTDPDRYLNLGKFYQEKRDLFLDLIRESRFTPLPCHGTYFQLLDYSRIADEPDVAFARRITMTHGVAAIPTSVFYHTGTDHNVLRFCFAKKRATLEQGAERLCRI